MLKYNKLSKGYNRLYKEEQLNKLNIIKSNIPKDYIRKDHLLLDVGCGTGISAEFFDCNSVGIDPCLEMLEQGNKAFYFQAKAENIPFKDKSFDAVISITAVHNFKDIKKGLEEIKRVSRDRIILSILRKSKNFLIIKKLVKEFFFIEKIIEEKKDVIFFTRLSVPSSS